MCGVRGLLGRVGVVRDELDIWLMTKISDLTPDDRNANKGTPRGLTALDNSLRKYGAGRSILIDKNNKIIAGNKTQERAVDIGLEDVIIVETDGTKLVAVKRTDLDLDTDNAARELAYFDNRVGQLDLDWDIPTLEFDLSQGLDLDGLFSEFDLKEMGIGTGGGTTDAEPQLDRAAELQEKWQVTNGEMFEIGTHKLICGDCTDPAIVGRVMGDEKAELCFTDPPFNVGYDYHGNFDDEREDYPEWTKKWIDATASYALSDVSWFFVMNITKNIQLSLSCLSLVGNFANLIVWPHGTGAIPSNRFALGWQAIMAYRIGEPYFSNKAQTKEGVISDERGGGINLNARITDIWDDIKPVIAGSRASSEAILENGSKAKVHHAQMPETLPGRAIVFCSKEDSIIYDPFLGSGTTLIACENLSRRGRGIEIIPAYCAVILERMTDAFPALVLTRHPAGG